VVCFNGDLAGGAVREAAGERESEPGAAGAVARLSRRPPDAGLEDRLAFVERNARTIVLDEVHDPG